MAKAFTLSLNSNYAISGTYFPAQKAAKAAKAVVIIAPAMGVEQVYYQAFAKWLADKGVDVLTFDYHGMGQSLSGQINKLSVTISDWVNHDCVAIIDKAEQLANGKPIYWLGHSLGGQIFGMIPNRAKISHLVTVASGSGYWRHSDIKLKALSLALWYVFTPLLTTALGYFPGKKLNLIGDIPKGVMRQWRRWCLSPSYLISAESSHYTGHYQSLTIPLTAYAFSDDELINFMAVERMHSFYSSADKTIKFIKPSDINKKYIGHFGFFRESYADSLWTSVAQDLQLMN